ncbi:MAG: hemolysin family protein [Bacteroidota bacterium]|nr:hemolysin family protein [Bacteroidota bacterium]MDP4214135.1 hemolysin family protein [Bacteroidota bacterium]MDP4249917.1 hemolysin family protein [Bacteroidota bacterium]
MINTNTLIWIIIAWLMITFFAGIEIAFANANRLTIELKKKQGLHRSILLSRLLDQPSRFISAILIGFNIFLVIFGLLVGETLSPLWEFIIKKTVVPQAWVDIFRLLFETFMSTLFILFFGELIPKAFFRAKADSLLDFFAAVSNFFYNLLYPVSVFFTRVSEWILKYVFNVRIDEGKDLFAKADLGNFFRQTGEGDEPQQELNTELFEAALSLPKVKVRECLIPRKEIEGIDLRLSIDDARKKFVSSKLSKLVVYEGNIDHVQGYIHQLDLFKAPAQIGDILLPIPAVPESMSATDLISKFSKERKSIAWVVDEFGGTAGIVTMEDLLEEIFGEIRDEYDTEEFEEKKLSNDEFIFAGRLELDYLNEKYNMEFPEKESETLSGFIINRHEAIPRLKEHIIIDDYEFEILSVSDTRIEMVKMKLLK